MTKAIGFLNLHDDLDLGPLTTNRSIASTSFLGWISKCQTFQIRELMK